MLLYLTIFQASAMPVVESEWRPRMERYVKGGQWQRAVNLLIQVEDAGGELSSGAYQAAITACSRAQPPAWEAALQVLDRSRAAEQTSEKCFGAAIHACRSEWAAALGLLRLMEEDGFPLNRFVATAAIKALGKAGEWQQALDVFRQATEPW